MITENRRETGFMHNFEIWRNIAVARSQAVAAGRHMGSYQSETRDCACRTVQQKMRVKCTSVTQMITTLSGGNQQKAIIGKWLAADARLLIFDEPTRGIDVGAKNEIYQIMRDLANEGKGILMVSSELPELLSVCDRIVVFGGGKIKAVFDAREAGRKIMLAAT